ncbi:MAG TPA: hypothetical protein VF486_03890 [Actinomycetes bacterium]
MRTLPPSGQRPRRLPRRRLHRTAFLAAGLYNLGWGLYAVVEPQWLFRIARMPLANHPEVFACLGMVIGLYGVLYLEVARVPERNWQVAAVGLAGKVLGPLGFAQLVLSGQWPLRAGIIVLTNDLLWWLPFGLYLHDAWTRRPCA